MNAFAGLDASGTLLSCVAMVGAIVTAAAVVGLLIAETRDSQFMRWVFKPMACAGFLAVGVAFAWTHVFAEDVSHAAYAALVVGALSLCIAGDVLLIPRSTGAAFRSGIFAFLSGHIVFAVAFFVRGIDYACFLISLLVLFPIARAVYRWLSPQIPEQLRIPVQVYVVVITVMVALAVSTWTLDPSWPIVAGATLFWLSDISVALDRFAQSNIWNRMWGIPFYFGAQLLLAWSIAV